MSLLLQLHADLPDHFPGHERKLYLWACRRKACRRKEGSVKGFRGTRQSKIDTSAGAAQDKKPAQNSAPAQVQTGLGEMLFGINKSISNGQENPFASSSSNTNMSSNPFASASSLAANPPQSPEPSDSLPQTFAEKAKIAPPTPDTTPSNPPQPSAPPEPWPTKSAFPNPYPTYYLDADKEYIDPEPSPTPTSAQNIRVDNDESSGSSTQELFESSMDKTFQKFADRLSQNPEQILRYEYAGQPLLYAKTDAVGKLFDATAGHGANEKVKTTTTAAGRIPRCRNCGGERVFEMQLTPHAITELEAEEEGLDGMDWGTILFGVCARDCQQKGVGQGQVGYVEEWVGVQWEELGKQK